MSSEFRTMPRAARTQTLSVVCGVALLTLGSMGLLGWLPGLEWLAKLRNSYIPMAPATALSFLFLGSALSVQPMLSHLMAGAVFVAAGLVAAIVGALILVQHVLKLPTDLESYLLPAEGVFGAVKLARMSPLTAVNFVFDGSGVAILGLASMGVLKHGSRSTAGILACFAASITATVLLGYFFGTPLLYGTTVIPMSLTAAVAFLALDVAIVMLAGVDHLPLRPFVGTTTRARLLRAFLPISFVTIVVNGFLFQLLVAGSSEVNHALFSALSGLLGAGLAGVAVVYVARVIGHDIDETTQAKIAVEREIVRVERERQEAQTQLMQAYKMSALGEMAANIAHEINNPLAIIDGKSKQLCELLERGPENLEKAKKFAKSITDTSLRLVKIVNGLRTMSRKSDGDPFVRKSLAELVEETVAICIAKIKLQGVRLEVEPFSESLEIECRPTDLSQVILNLVSNAHDAVEKLDEKWIKLSVRDEGDWVELWVTDSGSGIPSAISNRILEPFFTTKESGKGTGLGLSISANFVVGHGGVLSVDESSENTCFKIRLPKQQVERKVV